MATIAQRLQKFLSGPQGQKLVQQGQRQLAKPENQARLRKALARLQGKRKY